VGIVEDVFASSAHIELGIAASMIEHFIAHGGNFFGAKRSFIGKHLSTGQKTLY
jgi:hypothetical protein|tara:strand:+ start:1607 stop:1768 length:162 start_codon:yes stop_codon:yes gene_type:complete